MSDAPLRSTTLLAGGDDTIVACASATGRGALALIRISGARALHIARALGASAMTPRLATRVSLRHPHTGAALDDAVLTAFPGPRSFTGEDVVELSTHGGQVVPSLVVAACVAAGARLALPGEFTRRAVMNGKLDILQAEAIADLIDARTTAMQRQAMDQLDGGLSRRVLELRDAVVHLEALLAYDIDFPEEDDGPIDSATILAAAHTLLRELGALLATAPQAARLRDGALVVIAGAPNAGKSSLFNALLGESRALVTAIPGTTRDAIDALLDRSPVPLRLVDTAGMRDTTDEIERLGIEVSTRFLGAARVVLACGASAHDVRATIAAVAGHTEAEILPVHTKADLLTERDSCEPTWCYASAERGEGLAALLKRVDALVAGDSSDATDVVRITRERHQRALREAQTEVEAFLSGWHLGALPAPVAAVHLHAARDALASLVGAIGTEDILDRVFADFCVGK